MGLALRRARTMTERVEPREHECEEEEEEEGRRLGGSGLRRRCACCTLSCLPVSIREHLYSLAATQREQARPPTRLSSLFFQHQPPAARALAPRASVRCPDPPQDMPPTASYESFPLAPPPDSPSLPASSATDPSPFARLKRFLAGAGASTAPPQDAAAPTAQEQQTAPPASQAPGPAADAQRYPTARQALESALGAGAGSSSAATPPAVVPPGGAAPASRTRTRTRAPARALRPLRPPRARPAAAPTTRRTRPRPTRASCAPCASRARRGRRCASACSRPRRAGS